MGLITQTHRQYYNNSEQFVATSNQTVFTLTFDTLPSAESEFIIRIDGSEIDDDLYTYNSGNGQITFSSGRTAGEIVLVVLINRKHGDYRYISLQNIINPISKGLRRKKFGNYSLNVAIFEQEIANLAIFTKNRHMMILKNFLCKLHAGQSQITIKSHL